MVKKLTKEIFIKRCKNNIYNKDYNYDYTKVNYINTTTKVIISCPKHGEFKITPKRLLKGAGCKKCGYERTSKKLNCDTKKFIEKCKNIPCHKDKRYDYSLVDYKKCKIKVIVICPIHGQFKTTPSDFLTGYGCSKCGDLNKRKSMAKTTITFIEECKIKYKDKNYNYSKVEYINNKQKVIISCLKQFGLESNQKSSLTGVWMNDDKICAMGVRLSRWVTMHGFALNVNPDMTYFDGMIPCGSFELGVTSLKEKGIEISVESMAEKIMQNFNHYFIKTENEV